MMTRRITSLNVRNGQATKACATSHIGPVKILSLEKNQSKIIAAEF